MNSYTSRLDYSDVVHKMVLAVKYLVPVLADVNHAGV